VNGTVPVLVIVSVSALLSVTTNPDPTRFVIVPPTVNDPVAPPVPVPLDVPFTPLQAAMTKAIDPIMSSNEIFLLGIIKLLDPRFGEHNLLQELSSWQAASSQCPPALRHFSRTRSANPDYLDTRF